MADGKYTDAEVRDIIDRALSKHPDSGLSHEELLEVAGGVGLTREAVEAASREVLAQRGNDQLVQRISERKKKRFFSHLYSFLIVNIFLFTVNYLTTPGEWWFVFSALIWGLFLAFHARGAFSKEVSERALRKERKRLLAERKAAGLIDAKESKARDPKQLERAATEFGHAVQEQLGDWLSKATAELKNAQKPRVRVEPSQGGAPKDALEAEEEDRWRELERQEEERNRARR